MSISLDTAIETIRTIFQNTSESSMSLRDAYLALGRNLDEEVKNKQWFANKMSMIKAHNLLMPVYVQRNHRKILGGIKLTAEGRVLLASLRPNASVSPSRSFSPSASPSPSPAPEDERAQDTLFESGATLSIVNLEEAMKTIAGFKASHPEYEVEFNVKLKGSTSVGTKS